MSFPGTQDQLSVALQMLKQNVARRLRTPEGGPLWQPRYYDFNVWGEAKRIEKLRYMHRNPVKRGLVRSPEDWAWSSFRHYMSGVEGVVEIESQWTARKRERMGVVVGMGSQNPRPVSAQNTDTKAGHPRDGAGVVVGIGGQNPRPVSAQNADTRTGHPRS